MDIKAYRANYEAELANAAAAPEARAGQADGTAAAAPASPSPTPDLATRIPGLLDVLNDAAEPIPARVAALTDLCAAQFLGERFAVHRAAFFEALRRLATADTDAALRGPAIEVLARAHDAAIQQLLRDGLTGVAKALVAPVTALQLLGEDDHSGVTPIAFDLFHKVDDLAVKEAALRVLASDVKAQDLFARLVQDKSQPKSLRALSATGLNFLNPELFARVARDIVTDPNDYPDIRATSLGALANSPLHQRLHADAAFVDHVLKLGADHLLTDLRNSAVHFLSRP